MSRYLRILFLSFFLTCSSAYALPSSLKVNPKIYKPKTMARLARSLTYEKNRNKSCLNSPTSYRLRTKTNRFARNFRKLSNSRYYANSESMQKIISFPRESSEYQDVFSYLCLPKQKDIFELVFLDESAGTYIKSKLNGSLAGKYVVSTSNPVFFDVLKKIKLGVADADPIVVSTSSPQTMTPNDSYFSKNTDCSEDSESNYMCLSNLALIKANEAWAVSTSAKYVAIAILDDGVPAYSDDLRDNLFKNPLESSNGFDNDFNGYVGDVRGADTVANVGISKTYVYGPYHGAHVAGIAAAKGNNNIGLAGVVWDTTIVDVTVLNNGTSEHSELSGSIGTVTAGLQYSTRLKEAYVSSSGRNGANIKVVNMSLGAAVNCKNPEIEEVTAINAFNKAAREAKAAGILLVVAAGNSGINLNNIPDDGSYPITWPATCDIDNMITVGATSRTGSPSLTDFSNYGGVDIAAPGEDILSVNLASFNPDQYRELSGTSMAAPHVTGAAALIANQNLDLSAMELKGIILDSATYVENLSGKINNGRFLNVKAAIDKAVASKNINVSVKQNPNNRLDVDNDGSVTPLDVLFIINTLNNAPTTSRNVYKDVYIDVDGNGEVTPLDAVIVINAL